MFQSLTESSRVGRPCSKKHSSDDVCIAFIYFCFFFLVAIVFLVAKSAGLRSPPGERRSDPVDEFTLVTALINRDG